MFAGYKAKLKEANEALQAAQAAKQQQEQPGKQQQPDEHEEFVLAKRNSHAGTPLNRVSWTSSCFHHGFDHCCQLPLPSATSTLQIADMSMSHLQCHELSFISAA